MKSFLFLGLLILNSIAFAETISPRDWIEPSPVLLVKKKKKYIQIEEGNRIFIKANGLKYKGFLKITSDSTIAIHQTEFLLSEIDMIASPKKSKSLAMFFAALPVEFTGLVMFGLGFAFDTYLIPSGIATMIVGIVAAVIEARNGKRYHAYTLGGNKGSLVRKWRYSISN
ncbi:hypothetical protein OAU25_01095 [Crocinitomicaceae bacterium]|nr:hypothetical protein [Crocinitomicaceae bacterium]